MTPSHKIIVVGGGAGGLELVTKLGNKLGKHKQAIITLVDAKLTHLWKPLCHEVAAGTIFSYEDELSYISHAYQHHFGFEFGSLDGINRATKQIFLSPVLNEQNKIIIPRRELSYDTLVIAIGSTNNDFATPGVKQHCTFLDNSKQSEEFQQHLLEKILQSQSQLQQQGAAEVNIAIVGAGATGVELAAELHYAIYQAARYSRLSLDSNYQIKISIIEAADRILAALPNIVSETVQAQLTAMNIDVYTNQRVLEVTEKGLLTNTGLFIPADLKVWAAGIKAPDVLAHLDGLEVNRLNQLKVRSTLQTTIDDNIFALGDCASCPNSVSDETPVPPRAQSAHQQAMLLTKTLQRRLQNKSPLLYRYRDYGSLITISRKHTVGNLMGGFRSKLFIEGTLARLAYLSLYKKHQIALHGFWRVFLMTLADMIEHRTKPRMKLH